MELRSRRPVATAVRGARHPAQYLSHLARRRVFSSTGDRCLPAVPRDCILGLVLGKRGVPSRCGGRDDAARRGLGWSANRP